MRELEQSDSIKYISQWNIMPADFVLACPSAVLLNWCVATQQWAVGPFWAGHGVCGQRNSKNYIFSILLIQDFYYEMRAKTVPFDTWNLILL